MAGVAFGHPDGGVTLEGIAVTAARAAHGPGSRLLGRFERAAAGAGGANVNLDLRLRATPPRRRST